MLRQIYPGDENDGTVLINNGIHGHNEIMNLVFRHVGHRFVGRGRVCV